MYLRRSAVRLLSASSPSLISRPRTFTTVLPAVSRSTKTPAPFLYQRRWATGEAEAKKEETPISKSPPTPEEEVENAIQADNAVDTPQDAIQTTTSAAAAPADATETTEDTSSAPPTETTEETIPAAETKESEFSSTGSATNAAPDAAEETASTVPTPRRRESDLSRAERIASPKKTIYIGNLFFDVTENDLVKELARFGTITKCRLMRDSRGLSKGFGYVDFTTVEAATKAIETLNQQLFEGRRLNVQYAAFETQALEDRRNRAEAPSKPLNPPSKTLFIGNMSFEMTDRDLNNLFKGVRNVIDVRVAIDRRTGQPRGFAHADFIDVKSAMEAMKMLAGKETYGRKLRVDYSYGPSNAPRNQTP